MGNANVDLIVLRINEAQGNSAQVAHRAEGALLAAAGELNLAVREVRGRAMWNPAGLPPAATNAQAVNALCGMLGGTALQTLECRQAAAAALVAVLRPR